MLERWLKQEKNGGVLAYLAIWGLQHCDSTAAKKSIFDELWTKLLDQVILPSSLAFLFCTAFSEPPRRVKLDLYWASGNNIWSLSRMNKDIFELPRSHVLAWLDIICTDDFSEDQIKNIAHNSSTLSSHERRLALLLEHTTWKRGSLQLTALYLACVRRNHDAVTFFLCATYHLHSGQAVLELLFTHCEAACFPTPFAIAVRNHDTAILRILLQFEIKSTRVIGGGASKQGACIAQQWSHPFDRSGKESVFHVALYYFDENTICDLFQIGRPQDINMAHNRGRTALHLAAISGWLRLTQDLVELYGADIYILDERNHSPSFYAFYFHHHNVLEYLESKGASEVFSEKDMSDFDITRPFILVESGEI